MHGCAVCAHSSPPHPCIEHDPSVDEDGLPVNENGLAGPDDIGGCAVWPWPPVSAVTCMSDCASELATGSIPGQCETRERHPGVLRPWHRLKSSLICGGGVGNATESCQASFSSRYSVSLERTVARGYVPIGVWREQTCSKLCAASTASSSVSQTVFSYMCKVAELPAASFQKRSVRIRAKAAASTAGELEVD
eukprot:6206185-Pleurochrysis_carterae.AAC.7